MSKEQQGLDRDPLVGVIVGDAYRLLRLIGRGGMGAVYEASHVRLPKRFAVKILRGGLAADKESFARFKREAEIASSVGNRHIAHVFDFSYMPDGTPYMVLEYLQGEDLATCLKQRGRLTPLEAVNVCGQVASALAATHRQGIIHRDVKPDNIFLCRSEDDDIFVKLLDFGLSKVRGPDASLTQSAAFLGTPAYMSPEQAQGDVENIDLRTDIYSLGAVMYQALAGCAPFEGATVYPLLLKIINEQPPSLLSKVPSLPIAVDAVVMRALAKNPAQRYQSAREFFHAFRRAFRQPKDAQARFENEPTEPAARQSEDFTPEPATLPVVTLGSEHLTLVASKAPTTGVIHLRKGSLLGKGGLVAALAIVLLVIAFVLSNRSAPVAKPAEPAKQADVATRTTASSEPSAASPSSARREFPSPKAPSLEPTRSKTASDSPIETRKYERGKSSKRKRAATERGAGSAPAEPFMVKGADL